MREELIAGPPREREVKENKKDKLQVDWHHVGAVNHMRRGMMILIDKAAQSFPLACRSPRIVQADKWKCV